MKRAAGGVDAAPVALDETPTELEFHPMVDDRAKVTPAKIISHAPISPHGLKPHSLALTFPAYDKDDFDKLIADVRAHGIRQPITLFEDRVLDGRNRVEAATQLGMYCPCVAFEGTFDQAIDYVVSLNTVRRHLTTGQRAMMADLAKLPRGGDRSKVQNCTLKIDDAAKQLNVSPRTVKTAKAVKKADPALAEEVKQGKTKLSTAVRKTAALKTRPKVATAKKGPTNVEQ